jgi:hypothetical protein
MAKTTNAAASQVIKASPTAPHGLDEIVTTFGDIHAHIAANGTLKSTWEVGFPGTRKFAVSVPPVLGLVPHHYPDDMPPAHDGSFLIRLLQHLHTWATRPHHNFWRLLCFSSRAHWH